MIKLLPILFLLAATLQLQVVVDYSKDPYVALKEALGKNAIESPDACDDKVKHITSAVDPILNRSVFLYSLHVNSSYKDGDRCLGDYTRQRCETSVQTSSPAWMQGFQGKTFTYAWKMFLDPNFKVSNRFCHLHQIKLSGAGTGNPQLTLTARANVQLESQNNVLASAPLASFKGAWIQIREKITYNPSGCVDFTAHRITDGYLLMSFSGCTVNLDNNGIMIRPKFGFYRSLEDITNLRDQSIRMTDLCIGEGDSCFYDRNGNKYTPTGTQSLTTNGGG